MKPYKTRTGATQYKPAKAALERIIRGDNSTGYCLACGKSQKQVEPDARKYACHACKAEKVYGAEELIFMGLFH